MLRTDVLCRLLVERLMSLGPMTEAAAIEAVEWREPGRGAETIQWATGAGLVRRVRHDEGAVVLEAAGAPRSLAS